MKNTINIRYLILIGTIGLVVLLTGCSHRMHPSANVMQPVVSANYNFAVQEKYKRIEENTFLTTITHPASTFSIDVDTASYSNVRRFINNGELPHMNAVRIEELVNYFSYDYPEPVTKHPFSLTTEVATCPWNSKHELVQIGLKGRNIEQSKLPPANLVFLIDVSGSMYSRLSLVKSALKLLVKQMRPQDRIAIVVYAGAAGLALPPTSGNEQPSIMNVIDRLQAGGSTAGGEGINLAYATALEHFHREGNNRVILVTDGDFNVGPSSEPDLYELIEQKRQHGIFLTVLGFGQGNLNDATMELLADKGNGNYAYIDTLLEAKKVLVNEMGSTLFTIAKDVKIQVQFNPVRVKAYRLIGYENRLMSRKDFADDKKDAGDIGVGHTVTALYEIVPADKNLSKDSLTYVETNVKPGALSSDDILTVKLRYKAPHADQSQLISQSVTNMQTSLTHASLDFRFAAAVAEFGLLLRHSNFKGNASYSSVISRARMALGDDPNGYRAEFIQLAKAAELLEPQTK